MQTPKSAPGWRHVDRERLAAMRPSINGALEGFASVPEERWGREIALCLLTPQSSPVRAEAAMCQLEARRYPDWALSVLEISEILRSPAHYVRFHNVKARRLEEFRLVWPEVRELLRSGGDCRDERRVLVERIKGLGWKEASHALRNIGRRGLAILDRHILRNLREVGVIQEIPAQLTPARYVEIEGRFREYCDWSGEDMDVLDLFWWASQTGFVFK